jgi:orotidine-5'-phosphate decarboxylase
VCAQGGDAHAAVRAGWRADGAVIVNSSRAILYAAATADFAQAVRDAARTTRETLAGALRQA